MMNDFFMRFTNYLLHRMSRQSNGNFLIRQIHLFVVSMMRAIVDQIDSDLSETVKRSVDDVNRVLAQLHEVNKQVRRFELG